MWLPVLGVSCLRKGFLFAAVCVSLAMLELLKILLSLLLISP